jgi:DegV family protein with EDD domain
MDEISIVTDSTADLPEDLTDEYNIQVIRNLIIIDGHSLQDGKDISREEYYNRLPLLKPSPTTATASSGTYHQLYESLFKRGAKYILSIHPPGKLSGIINAANFAAQSFGDRIRVFDSGQVSLGLGFQILAAAEAIRQGASLDNVLRLLEEMHNRVGIIAMLDTLEYIRRSGRVSWARARIGNLLQIKPFIELKDGTVSSLGESRTRGKGIQRLKEFLIKLGNLERLAILHTNAEQDAHKFLDNLHIHLSHPPLVINVTTVIGTHVGPNALGFAAVTQQGW